MTGQFVAAVRTVVQAAIGGVIAWAAGKGIEIPAEAVEVVTLLLIGLVTFGLNKVGERWPVVNQIVSLGLSSHSPTY
jgi:hypothetical protein